MTDLCFENVSITYRTSSSRGDVVAVSEVSLDLPAGATLGIAGESGSGKTTLIMSALRLLPKSARLDGRVLLGGKDLSQLNFGQIRAVRWSQASIVFQGALHSLNPVREVGWQIIEALTPPCEGYLDESGEAEGADARAAGRGRPRYREGLGLPA
jgi:peptide/nickel transport system ATP-binding protein